MELGESPLSCIEAIISLRSAAVIMRSAIESTPDLLAKDPLTVNVQDFWEFPYDASRLKAPMPEGMMCQKPIYEFTGFLERKFYTYNAANGTASFVGALLGYKYLADAAHDERILKLLDGVYTETATALSKKHNFPFEEQWAFTRTSLRKLQDRNIIDYIERNAREPQRKITSAERIVAPMLLQQKYGKDSSILEMTLAAALLYTPAEEQAWNAMLAEQGYEGILTSLCGLDPNSDLFARVLHMAQTKSIL